MVRPHSSALCYFYPTVQYIVTVTTSCKDSLAWKKFTVNPSVKQRQIWLWQQRTKPQPGLSPEDTHPSSNCAQRHKDQLWVTATKPHWALWSCKVVPALTDRENQWWFTTVIKRSISHLSHSSAQYSPVPVREATHRQSTYKFYIT